MSVKLLFTGKQVTAARLIRNGDAEKQALA